VRVKVEDETPTPASAPCLTVEMRNPLDALARMLLVGKENSQFQKTNQLPQTSMGKWWQTICSGAGDKASGAGDKAFGAGGGEGAGETIDLCDKGSGAGGGEGAGETIDLCDSDDGAPDIAFGKPNDDDDSDLQAAIAASLGEEGPAENRNAAGNVQAEDMAHTVKKRRRKGAAADAEQQTHEKRRRREPGAAKERRAGAAGGAAGDASSAWQEDVVHLITSPCGQVGGQVGERSRPSVEMIRSKLIELGLEPAVAARKAENAHRCTSSLQAAINHAVLQCEEVQKEDMITGELVSTRDMFICECECSHKLSYESFFRKILSDVRDRCVPACPLNAVPSATHPNGCKYVLTQKETEDVVDVVMQNEAWRAQLVDDATFALLKLQSDQMLINGQKGWKSDLVTSIYLQRLKTERGFLECPQEGCEWFVEAQQARRSGSKTLEVVCQKCNFRFCAECKKVSHMNTPCEQMLSYKRQWDEWLGSGRPLVLARMAQVDQQFVAALQAHNAKKEQHEADMRNREAQYAQMLADEKWKETHCKRCPWCGFVVNKLDGCDEMVCGRDYHGNVVQGGCLKVFHWKNMAKPYLADSGHHPKVVPFAAAAPEQVEAMKSKFASDGSPLLCSLCSDQIRGPHAVCLNCPNWGVNHSEGVHQVCIKCQDASATGSSYFAHLPSHVCRIFNA